MTNEEKAMANIKIKKSRGDKEEIERFGLSMTEGRLIPYFHYCCVNHQTLNESKMTRAEMDVADKWVDEGYILDPFEFPCTILKKEFWDMMNDFLWQCYASRKEE